MSRDAYVGGSRSPRGSRFSTVDRFLNREYPESPIDRRPFPRSHNSTPDQRNYGDYYRKRSKTCSNCNCYKDVPSVLLLDRGRPLAMGSDSRRYRSGARSLDRYPPIEQEHEFLPARERRERSLERFLFFDEDSYATRSAPQSPASHQLMYPVPQYENTVLHRDIEDLKVQLDLTDKKLGSSIHSLETFWSPDFRKDQALPFEESAKFSFINDALKILSSENQISVEVPWRRVQHTTAYRNLVVLLQILLVLLYLLVVVVEHVNKLFKSNMCFSRSLS